MCFILFIHPRSLIVIGESKLDEPSRIERMVGEIVGLRMLVAALLEKQGGSEAIRESLLDAIEVREFRSDTPEGAARIKACGKSMLRNFPAPMDERITKN